MKIPGLNFSWKRALGITKVKQKVAKDTGVPTSRSGLERKIGNAILNAIFGKKEMIDEQLQEYITTEILPLYDTFDAAHGRDHALMVIRQSMELASNLDVDENMAYAIAAYHDSGLRADRKTHHLVSGQILRADSRLRQWFSEEQITTMAEACEDHRASSDHEPRTIYGRIVAEADRFIDPDTIIRRTVQYGLANYPELDREGHWRRTLEHLHAKYAEGGYLRLWFEHSPNTSRLAHLRQIIDNEAILHEKFNSIFDSENSDSESQQSSISELTMSQLIQRRYTFIIPYQQRGYRWRIGNLLELLADLLEFIRQSRASKYCLQPLSISVKDCEGRTVKVWDGQQRLTTLYLLFKALNMPEPFTFSFERDIDRRRADFLKNPTHEEDQIDLFFIYRAYLLFCACIDENTAQKPSLNDREEELFQCIRAKLQSAENVDKLKRLLLGELEGKSIIFFRYTVPEDVATDIFRDINSGKISLTNSELIKALLLSEHSLIPATSRPTIAAQFADIEATMLDDHFWYMLQSYETKMRGGEAEKITNLRHGAVDAKSRLLRIDLLFNLVAGVSYENYLRDPLASFQYFYDNRADIAAKWNDVLRNFQILKAIYSNVESYHYVGFLTYCNQKTERATYAALHDYITWYSSTTRKGFIEKLIEKVKDRLNVPADKLYQLDFDKDKESLRRVLLLHNIATLLHIYNKQNASGQLHLDCPFEIFPYELLYRQMWNIEHISPATDNPLKSTADRQQWIASTRSDYPDLFQASEQSQESRFTVDQRERVSKTLATYHQHIDDEEGDEAFNTLFRDVITFVDNLSGSRKLKDKYILGNYALLDESTNKCFHNSLFPTKRRIVIAASGHKVNTLTHEVKLVYLPPCTKSVFMKFFSTYPSLSLTDWSQDDADAYCADIYTRLTDFLK